MPYERADPGVNWRVVGTGDFNGDGRDDLVWRSDSGQLSTWLGQANGGFTDNAVNSFTSVATNWRIAGTGDFNGDGRADILWRRNDGAIAKWEGQANGTLLIHGEDTFQYIAAATVLAGIGDFNGDGRDDILWRSEGQRLWTWEGTGSSFRTDALLENSPA